MKLANNQVMITSSQDLWAFIASMVSVEYTCYVYGVQKGAAVKDVSLNDILDGCSAMFLAGELNGETVLTVVSSLIRQQVFMTTADPVYYIIEILSSDSV